jgi:FkbM family methyltransferase
MANIVLSLASGAARLIPMKIKRLIYRIPWLAGWLRGTLNRAAPSGLTEVKIAAGGLAGMRLLVDLQTEKDYWLGTYEPDLQVAILDLVNPEMVAYDLGANIGYMTLLLAKAVGTNGLVVAIEAFPENARRLAANIALNQMQERVRVIEAAVSDRSAPVQFRVGPSGKMGKIEGSGGRQDTTKAESINVQGYSLDDFVYRDDQPVPDVIKMDIEGGEVMAIPGMRRVLTQARPLVLLELHGSESARVAWSELRAAGYRLCYLKQGYGPITSQDELDWKTYLVAFPEAT